MLLLPSCGIADFLEIRCVRGRHFTQPAMPITFPRHVPTCETRRYRVQHRGRQDYMIEVEVADACAVQMQFGSDFNFQRSGYHGHWQDLNSTTVFLRQVRYKGADADWKHTLIFFKDTSPGHIDTWRCTSFPIVMSMIHGPPPEWARSNAVAADLTQELFAEYLRTPPLPSNSKRPPSSSSSDIPTPTSYASSSTSSPRVATGTIRATVSESSASVSATETSWTWLDYQQHTRIVSFEEAEELSETYHVPDRAA